jgi:lactate dehydrogenase-like 2-hydroxyacid dehydrogenase
MTPETKHLIDQKALTKMKRSAYLINTSRGPVVDEAALAWALKERLIAGAAARRLRERAGDPRRPDVARERAADPAPRERDHRNTHRDGDLAVTNAISGAEWPAARHARP